MEEGAALLIRKAFKGLQVLNQSGWGGYGVGEVTVLIRKCCKKCLTD